MDSLEAFAPAWGCVEDWNGAYEKTEDYLRAYGVDSHFHRARLVTLILRRVSERWRDGQTPAPLATLAVEETNRMLNAWFARLLDRPAGPADGFAGADARVALLLCDASTRWPYSFLEPGPIPDELKAAVQKGMIRAGPELQISSMVPRPIDLGLLPELTEDTLDVLNRWPVVKALLGALLFLALLGGLFWMTR